jgi:arylformamidase
VPELIDLTLPTRKHWRWFARTMLKDDLEDGDPFRHTYMTINMHGFTHADGPNHFLADGMDVAQVPLSRYYGDAVVVDLTHIGANTGVTADDLEKQGGDVRPGDIVLLRTDWTEKADWESMDFWGRAPYTEASACEWLIDREVKLVGYDYPPDHCLRYQVTDPTVYSNTVREDYTTHHHFFPKNIAVIEYLTNLKSIPTPRFTFFALPIPFEGSDGSPVRAVAMID